MVWGTEEYKRVQAEKARQRRALQEQIKILSRQRDELFGKWIFKKAIDEDFVRKEGVRIYLAIKQLQAQYDAI